MRLLPAAWQPADSRPPAGRLSVVVLAQELAEEEVRNALREGRVFFADTGLRSPGGFLFHATNNLGVFEAGDSVPMASTTRLVMQAPSAARVKLFRNEEMVGESTEERYTFTAKEPGAYRAEVWLSTGEKEQLWIASSTIRLETPSPEATRLPSQQLSDGVVAHRDITYREGRPEDAAKHKLNVIVPKDGTRLPVLFFVHGGAWRSGDRSLYFALGNRFARDGLAVVVPSYRLSPANQHPAHIEDVAAAFAWTRANIAAYGGDPDRIYIAGHSAGGHLVSLLALNQEHLSAHGLNSSAIRGVMTLSGVYEVSSLVNIFGEDQEVRRQASPLHHVKKSTPPFLVTYCQWDYATLPAQAKTFHAAMLKAGANSKLVYVAGENHISEIVNVVKPDDPTAKAMLRFIFGGD